MATLFENFRYNEFISDMQGSFFIFKNFYE